MGFEKTLYLTDGSNDRKNQLQTKHSLNLSNVSLAYLTSVMSESFILCSTSQGEVIVLSAPTRD